MALPKTIKNTMSALNSGEITALSLIEDSLTAIKIKPNQGSKTFLKIHEDAARHTATYYDKMRDAGEIVPPYAGVPIAVKDNFDMAGDVTTCGSKVLSSSSPASQDAPAVLRLRNAGFILIGRTNMTEFAYSGLGLNPHFGTPSNPYSGDENRIPGGSSSGTAVAISAGMTVAGIGTDTGGSCRIPAAFCGLVGFKPSSVAIPLSGVFPLSTSLDAVGPLGSSVDCCAKLFATMSGLTYSDLPAVSVKGLRIGVVQNYVRDGIEDCISHAIENAEKALADAGAQMGPITVPSLDTIPNINGKGGFAAAESFATLHKVLESSYNQIDPRVSSRIAKGGDQTAVDYIELIGARKKLIQRYLEEVEQYDVVLIPTVPMLAPQFSDLENDADYSSANLLALRNSSIANMLDIPAISLPMITRSELPTGLTLFGRRNEDLKLLRIARSVEQTLLSADLSWTKIGSY